MASRRFSHALALFFLLAAGCTVRQVSSNDAGSLRDMGTSSDVSFPDTGPRNDAFASGDVLIGNDVFFVNDAWRRDVGVDAFAPDAFAFADAGPNTPSQSIALARSAIGAVDVYVHDVIVTYVVPAIGTDPAGFFVQADMAGPALFVAVDPTTTTPVLAVGDVVSFHVTMVGVVAMQTRALAIRMLTRTATGMSTAALVQDVTSASDLVSAAGLELYESSMSCESA